ncbi:hypothetical protein Tco_0707671 [Tanacetum coccineum]|uniref:Uncharacterized protein n=1 Tax=Tanacetum coccineum TaxID=301880 RepID=A0ABQ4YD08_9ASTR
MNQNYDPNFCYNLIYPGFDQYQPTQFPDIYHPPHATDTELLQAREDLMETIQAFFKEYDHIPPEEKRMALLLAEERFLKIKQAMEEEQNQPEAEQEEKAAESFTPYGNFSMIDNEKVLQETQTFLRKFSQDIHDSMSKLLEDVRNIKEELSEYINSPSWDRPTFFNDDDDEYTVIWTKPKAITPDLPTEEPEDSLIMGDEHLSTILETEESSVEALVPIPSESEDFFDNESECDMPVNDKFSLIFTTFSNPLFNYNDDFTSSDDESLSDEDILIGNFKIYSNPLFEDEEIISTKIDPHSFNAESNLIESLLNRDTLIDSSPKFDYLLEAFSNPIPPGIEKADFDLEEEIRLAKNLSYDNSSPRPP